MKRAEIKILDKRNQTGEQWILYEITTPYRAKLVINYHSM